ncbi:MAG: Hsp20/alpha crystallin family protein [Candidatus Binatia bacterium]
MTLYRWNPMREFADAQKQLAAFLNGADKDRTLQQGQGTWTPAVDITETPEGYRFAVEIPGMDPNLVDFEVKEDTLTVRGERKGVGLQDGERFLHRERRTGRFARVFRMAKPVDAEHVTAEYRNGVLFVVVPLRQDAKSRRIPVQG